MALLIPSVLFAVRRVLSPLIGDLSASAARLALAVTTAQPTFISCSGSRGRRSS